MPEKSDEKPALLTEIEMDAFFNEHVETVRPLIHELDRKQVEARAKAHSIPVTNATK